MRGNDYTCAKIERRDYIILKLFSGDGFQCLNSVHYME